MKKAAKITAALAMMGLLAFAAAGCGGDDSAKSGAAKDTVKFGVTNFADSLEPTDNFFSWVVMRYGLGECLVKFDDKMNLTPWLAESWSISDDKLTWTFKINDKAVFSNGNKVTADAVKKSIERTFEKSNRAETFFQFDNITADGQNLIIKTKNPVPTLPGMLADPLFIIIDTSVTDRDYAKQGPICTGPYMVKEYSKAKAVMEVNPNYWDGKVPFKVAEIPTIDDPNTRAMALQSGEIDMAINIASGDLQLFQDKAKYNISELASLRTVLAQINMNEGRPCHDPKVRAALISCLDRETYNKVLLKDSFITGKAPIPPSLDYGFDQLTDPNAYNVERAKQLLAEAGWKDTNNDGYVDKDGKNLELDFIYYSGRAELPLYAEATQSDAKKIGIKVNMKNIDYNVLDSIRQSGDFDLCISNILTANSGDPAVYLNWYWKTGDPQNATGYSNPEYDALSDRLAVEFDPAKRRDLMIQMQQILLNDGAGLFFGYPKTNMVSKVTLKNADIKPADYYWLTKDVAPAD